MSVNLKMGFNNNLITNSSYTKFLGVTLDNTLSWNNHIDLLMKKLSMDCSIIRNVKTYLSASSLKVIFHAFFHLAMSYGITFWGNWSHSSAVFSMQKRQLELWKYVAVLVNLSKIFVVVMKICAQTASICRII